jgi:hypothetical protein
VFCEGAAWQLGGFGNKEQELGNEKIGVVLHHSLERQMCVKKFEIVYCPRMVVDISLKWPETWSTIVNVKQELFEIFVFSVLFNDDKIMMFIVTLGYKCANDLF